jgi:hypothetical protein
LSPWASSLGCRARSGAPSFRPWGYPTTILKGSTVSLGWYAYGHMGTAKGSLVGLGAPAPSLGALGKRRKGQPKCFRPSGGAAGRNSVYPGSLGVEMGKRVELRELMKPEIIRCCIEAYTSSTVRTATPLYRAALSLSYHSLQPFNWTVRILSHTRRLINDCSRGRDSSRPVGSVMRRQR